MDSYDVEWVDDATVAALKARLAAARGSDSTYQSPDEWLPRWLAEQREFIRIVSNGKHFQIGIVESPDNQQLSGRWQLPMPEERAAKPKETRARR